MNPLPPNLLFELAKASPNLETTVDLELDSGTITLSQTAAHGIPILKSTGSLLHKLQPAHGKTLALQ